MLKGLRNVPSFSSVQGMLFSNVPVRVPFSKSTILKICWQKMCHFRVSLSATFFTVFRMYRNRVNAVHTLIIIACLPTVTLSIFDHTSLLCFPSLSSILCIQIVPWLIWNICIKPFELNILKRKHYLHFLTFKAMIGNC